jgi:hypothetical protein
LSTDHMPNPPDTPTSLAPTQGANAQTQSPPPGATAAAEATAETQVQPAAPFNLAEDMAGIIEANADVLAQRLYYHSQTLFGVSAIGIDVVNGRNSAMLVAQGLRERGAGTIVHTLISLGDPQVPQINDNTLPFRMNSLVAGLLEGLIVDTVNQAYADNPDRKREARLLLESYFQPANEQLQYESRSMVLKQAQFPALSAGPGQVDAYAQLPAETAPSDDR